MAARSLSADPGSPLLPADASLGAALGDLASRVALPLQARAGAAQAIRIPVPVDLAAVRPKVLEALEFLAAQAVTPEELSACELALVEGCNNAILYAFDTSAPICIELICFSDHIDIHIIDHTPGFDLPTEIKLPDSDAEHGRGLFLIHSMMDEITYLRSPRENRLTLRKVRRHGPLTSGQASLHVSEVEKQLALSREVLSNMASELCHQVIQSRQQQEEMDNRLLAHELEIARKIQQSLLPKVFPVLPGYSVSGFCLSARQVGGDFYDLIEMPGGRVLMAVADVMGKGVPAALFAATLRTLLRAATRWTQKPSDLLARINALLYEELSAVDMFITLQLAVIDVQRGWLQLASAGHNPLLYIGRGFEPQFASPEGMPLGILPEVAFEEQAIALRHLEAALLFTDGLTEARNTDGELFGQDRLSAWLFRNRWTCRTAGEYADSFLTELSKFQGAAAPRDDQTFLILARDVKQPAEVLETRFVAGR